MTENDRQALNIVAAAARHAEGKLTSEELVRYINNAEFLHDAPKKKYKVYVREVWVQGYAIEASSEAEAIEFAACEGDAINGAFEYSHTLAGDVYVEEG